MNKHISIIGIIFFSLISGFLGSLISQNFNNHSDNQNRNTFSQTNKNISITNLENEIINIVEEVSPSVVNIIISKDLTVYRNDPFNFFRQPVGSVSRKVGGGTGFFITKDGTILTNKHVISDTNAQYTVILKDGTEYEAKILAVDPLTDLAVIKINPEENVIPLELIQNSGGKHGEIKIGQFAIAIGNALAEFQNSVALGVISGQNRSIEAGGDKLSGLLQTDAAINPGNSGGPLVNLDGKVMGINTAISGNAQGIGFSIPLSQKRIDYILNSIEKFGEIKKPFIGINYSLLNSQSAQEIGVNINYGAYIFPDGVVENSSAQKAGLQGGDIILSVDKINITQNNDLRGVLQNKIPGEIIELEIMRNNIKKTINLTLGMGN